MPSKAKQNNICRILYCIVLAVIFNAIFSHVTSFLYKDILSTDASIFFTIGKYWMKDGTLPYVGLWDLKGPMIFLINGLGYLLTKSLHGVAFIQDISLAISFYFAFRIFRERFSEERAYFLTFMTAVALTPMTEGGNSVEEFLLPLLTASFYYVYCWTAKVSNSMTPVDHPAKFAVVYGAVLGFSLMTRLTNALGCCGAVAVISLYLAFNGRWKNLFQNILFFLGGFLSVALPFVIYFALHGALSEMWYGTLLYSLEYLENSSSITIGAALSRYFLCFAFLSLGILLLLYNNKRIAGLTWIMSSVFLAIWFKSGNGFVHYGIITLPYFSIAINELKSLWESKRPFYPLFRVAYAALLLFTFLRIYSPLKGRIEIARNNGSSFISECQHLLADIPLQERSSFVAYNYKPQIYYFCDIKPCIPYFAMQDFESRRGSTLSVRIQKSIEESKPKWILFQSDGESVITSILSKDYYLYADYQDAQLYHRN